jgi:hypothetical protein
MQQLLDPAAVSLPAAIDGVADAVRGLLSTSQDAVIDDTTGPPVGETLTGNHS